MLASYLPWFFILLAVLLLLLSALGYRTAQHRIKAKNRFKLAVAFLLAAAMLWLIKLP